MKAEAGKVKVCERNGGSIHAHESGFAVLWEGKHTHTHVCPLHSERLAVASQSHSSSS